MALRAASSSESGCGNSRVNRGVSLESSGRTAAGTQVQRTLPRRDFRTKCAKVSGTGAGRGALRGGGRCASPFG